MSGVSDAVRQGPVQLLLRDDENKLVLNTDQLEAMLKDEKVKDRQLVVVSVVGAFRRGKSFLLNFMLRYLRCNGGDDWVVDGGAISLEGFSWRGGPDRDTTGILVWPEVFLVGKDKALILMDTQGTFDSKTSFKDNAIIFALSTLVSSVQIFNLYERIQMDDVSNLQYFCEFGNMVQEKCKSKPFQKLIFLIRDWKFPQSAPFGFKGGEMELKKWITDPEANKEQAKMIETCFSDISCFLLPHPGKKVSDDENFKGCIEDIESKFLDNLENFIEKVLRSSLVTKKVGGKDMAPTDLVLYLRKWIVALQDENIEPKTLYESMAEVSHQKAARAALDEYEGRMQTKCGGADSVSDLAALHEEAKTAALQLFENNEMFGGKRRAEPAKEALLKDIEARYAECTRQNDAKQEQERKLLMKEELRLAKEAALKCYSRGMEACNGVAAISDLPGLHAATRGATLTKFAETAGKYDEAEKKPYVAEIEKELSDQLAVFETRNQEKLERERKEGVRKELREELESAAKKYQKYMEQHVGGSKTTENFGLVHDTASKQALESFKEQTSQLDQTIVAEFYKRLQRELQDNSLLLKMSNDEKLSKEQEKQMQESLRTAKEEAFSVYEVQMETQTGSTKPVADLTSVHKAALQKSVSDFNVTGSKFKKHADQYLKDLKKDMETRFETYKRKNADLEAQEKAKVAREELRDLKEDLVRALKVELSKKCDSKVVSVLEVFLADQQTSTINKFDQEAENHADSPDIKKIRRDLEQQVESLCALYRQSQRDKQVDATQNSNREVRAAAREALSTYQSTMSGKCGGRKSVPNLQQLHSSTKSDVITTFDLVAEGHRNVGAVVEQERRQLELKMDSLFAQLETANTEKAESEKEKAEEKKVQNEVDEAMEDFTKKIKKASEDNKRSMSGFLKDANKAKDDVLTDFNSNVKSIDPLIVSRFRRQLENTLQEKYDSYHTLAKAREQEGGCVIS